MKRAAATGLRDGKLSPTTRAFLARVIAARTGLTPADAEQRVDQALSEAKTRPTRHAKPPLISPCGSQPRCSQARCSRCWARWKAVSCAIHAGGSPAGAAPSHAALTVQEATMPVILWLLGMPLTLIILLMVLHVV